MPLLLPPLSLFLLLLPLLLSLLSPPPLPWYPAAFAVLPVALTTNVTADLATTVATISRCCYHFALSCCVSLAIVLTAVAVALPPLLPLLFPPCCPRPGPCCHPCRHRCCRATPVLAAADAMIPHCCRCVAPALAVFVVILAVVALPPLYLMPPLKLIF